MIDRTDRGGSYQADIEKVVRILGDDVELDEYPNTAERERRKTAKREEKKRWLDEQDDMKFSHSVQFNAVPDWSSHYIAYSNLKKLSVLLPPTIHFTPY